MSAEVVRENIASIKKLEGFDVVIICCSSRLQASYWQKRFEDGKGSTLSPSSLVIAVEEDWPGGAGNALGTLFAFENAAAVAKAKYNVDLREGLGSGRMSAALYHTAGKGTRLAPLPGAENNNKPGVKLPATVQIGPSQSAVTILEAVVMQTGCYAKSRPGRLSVFWGDQIFIPTVDVRYSVSHHVDILCSLGPMMSEAEWQEKGMDKYGLIAVSERGEAAQVEKVSHATACKLLASLGQIKSVGASLGSFSISSAILFVLLEEFAGELQRRVGKLDSDPHLWMPMTLEKTAYLHLMAEKGASEEESSRHYERIAAMMQRFNATPSAASLGLFGPVDVGQGVFWWDYGQLKLYQRNTLLMAEDSTEASLIRSFYGIQETARVTDSDVVNTTIDPASPVSSCALGSAASRSAGSVQRSVLSNVKCKHVEVEGSVLINVTARSIVAQPGSIVYNVFDTSAEGLVVGPGDVLAGVSNSDGTQTIIRSHMSICGGKTWETTVLGNAQSFEDVHSSNVSTCPIDIERVNSGAHAAAWRDMD